MNNSNFSKAQTVSMFGQYDSGVKLTYICRDEGITTATFYGQKPAYRGTDAQWRKELKALQEENLNKIRMDQGSEFIANIA